MIAAAFVTDLMFRSKIDVAARAGNGVIRYPRTVDELVAAAPALILIDLGLKSTDPVALVAEARKITSATIVAYGSHVDQETLGRARRAGANQVLPRSAFVKMLPELFRP